MAEPIVGMVEFEVPGLHMYILNCHLASSMLSSCKLHDDMASLQACVGTTCRWAIFEGAKPLTQGELYLIGHRWVYTRMDLLLSGFYFWDSTIVSCMYHEN